MILCIDLGLKTTGLAISEGQLASPYTTLKHKSQKEALDKVIKVCNRLNVKTIVIGFVEGKIKSLFTKFAKRLKHQNPGLEIILWDETLTTGQAQEYMIKLQIPMMRRRKKEHEVAAAIILQSYLDSR